MLLLLYCKEKYVVEKVSVVYKWQKVQKKKNDTTPKHRMIKICIEV